MKPIKQYTIFLSAILLIVSGCTKMLDEENKSIMAPSTFKTLQGIDMGVIGGYQHMRYFQGSEGFMSLSCFGTDECGDGRDGGNKYLNHYDPSSINANDGQCTGLWNRVYEGINTLNGVIEYGNEITVASTADKDKVKRLLAEARFVRAYFYFTLVQQFGGVCIKLELTKTADLNAHRSTEAEVWKVIIADLTMAIPDLPVNPSATPNVGRAFQAAARHLLAKSYLTRAGRLPYLHQMLPEAMIGSQVAYPEYTNATADYDSALYWAKDLIDNQAAYGIGLLPDNHDVFAEGNEHNKEVLFTVEWNNDPVYNNVNGEKDANNQEYLRDNRSSVFFRPLYESQPGMKRTVLYGRPWMRFKPNIKYMYSVAFAERKNDSRFDKNFQVMWLCNDTGNNVPHWKASDVRNGYCTPAQKGKPKFWLKDTALLLVDHYMSDVEKAKIPYTVFSPGDDSLSNKIFPSMCKYDDSLRVGVYDYSTRPFIVFKFSETYLIAAEASFMLNKLTDAKNYINVIRERAAFRTTNTSQKNTTTAAAMDIAEGDLSIDFILEERTRELYGEAMRWQDLVRTGKLYERTIKYNEITSDPTNTVGAITNLAQDAYHHFLLRPIPQSQIDACVDPATIDNKFPQNPGY